MSVKPILARKGDPSPMSMRNEVLGLAKTLGIGTVRKCLRNLVILWGNYLINEVAGIPLLIGEHPERWMLDVTIHIQSTKGGPNSMNRSHPLPILYVRDLSNRVSLCPGI